MESKKQAEKFDFFFEIIYCLINKYTDMSKKKFFELAYKDQGGAPWANVASDIDPSAHIPKKLVEAVETGIIKPCRTLDIGCGEGYAAIYLEQHGFSVTGIDYSKKAIEYSKKNAKKAKAKIKFLVKNVDKIETLRQKFGLIIDIGLLHHLPKNKWKKYSSKIYDLLDRDGKYMLFCFNDKCEKIDEKRKKEGMKIYASSIDELKNFLGSNFLILQNEVLDMKHKWPGKFMNYLLAKKHRPRK